MAFNLITNFKAISSAFFQENLSFQCLKFVSRRIQCTVRILEDFEEAIRGFFIQAMILAEMIVNH